MYKVIFVIIKTDTDMLKLNCNVRATELDTVSDSLIKIYNRHQEISGDNFLRETFQHISKLSDDITQAIRRDKIKISLTGVDNERDKILLRISKLLDGFVGMSTKEQVDSAIRLKKTFDKFGMKITRENYIEESSLIEGLLIALSTDESRRDISNLQGFDLVINELRVAEDKFKDTMIKYNSMRRIKSETVHASDIKKELLAYINKHLVVYLNSLILTNREEYFQFANEVDDMITRANKTIKLRKDSKNSNLKIETEEEDNVSEEEQVEEEN